LYAHVYSID